MGAGLRGQGDDILRNHRPQHRGGTMPLLLLGTSLCVQSRLLGNSETAGEWTSLPLPLQGSSSPTSSLKHTEGTDGLSGPKKYFGPSFFRDENHGVR